ncbi:MAG: immunoglobulin domain-containing protein [Verrucomicrobiota bacterium]
MKRILLVLSVLAYFTSVRADVVYNEPFNYVDGLSYVVGTNSSGATNWFAHSGSGDSFIVNKRLTVSMSGSADVNRPYYTGGASGPLTNTLNSMFASFTVICTNVPTQSNYFAHFQSSGTTFQGRVWNAQGSLPGTWKLGVTTTSSAIGTVRWFPVDLATNTEYQVVVNWDETQGVNSIATLWVNPISSSDPSTTAGDAVNGVISTTFGFRQPSGAGNGRFLITNLVVATTFDEAATNVWPAGQAAPKMVYSPAGGTNFTGSQVRLSGVAASPGLGNLVYTWLKNGQPFANPDGNTNVLSFPSAAISDTGDYQLVATTPYSLSVTSAVANLWVTNAPIPPSFVSQPVSKTAYSGDTVIFSTTVTSPGNVTYQWKANGTDIPGETGPTLTLNNVTTAISGTQYRVGVTNDIVPNGILSTNAVLTVVDPTTVSVAFLRSLVDPVTLQAPAGSTTPYKVTGTITTYTNITTGNTASYYLQDGTAGINIFATFGSTFRPAQGDIVTFVGVVSSFTSGLELFADTVNRPYTSYSIGSSGNALPAPISIPFSLTNTYSFPFIATNLAGSLVKLSNVYFGANAGATIGGGTITVTNASGEPFYLNFFSQDLDTAGQVLPEFAASVTGVLYGNHPNYSLAVTKFSDIVTLVPPVSLGYSLSGGNLTLTWSDPSFSLQAASVVTGPYNTIIGATSGFTTNTSADQLYFRLVHP